PHAEPAPRDLHAFPTRRSSDLFQRGASSERIATNRSSEAPLRNESPPNRSSAPCNSDGRAAIGRAHPRSRRKRLNLHGLGIAQKDRKSTRLNSSHVKISYAVFC